jgi:hypothetical protein
MWLFVFFVAILRVAVMANPSWHSGRAIGFVVVLLIGLRATSEFGMMSAHGSDPQMPIWKMFMWAKLVLWSGAAFICSILVARFKGRWSTRIMYALFLCWVVAICISSWKYFNGRRALVDAANPLTSPDRLRQLAHFDGIQAGYELDNRLASNPNSPADVLRLLATRDQLGTKMCLAMNPRSPKDVLRSLSRESDEWIQKGLKRNPNFTP